MHMWKCVCVCVCVCHVQGVLTIHLIRCINLVGENPNVWVRMLASDDDKEQEFRCVCVCVWKCVCMCVIVTYRPRRGLCGYF